MKKIAISAIMVLALAGASAFAAQGNKKAPAKTTKMATSNKMEGTGKTTKKHHRRHHAKAKAKTGGKMSKNSKM